jgi:ankyrin repeat protein
MKYFKIFTLILAFSLTLISCEKAVDSKLREAIKNKDLDTIKEMVEKGADYRMRVKPADDTAFLIAAEKGDLELVKSLLGKGVDINQGDGLGRTALMDAAFYDHFEVIKYLVETGVDINKVTPLGTNVLISAIYGAGKYDTVKYLLEKKADIVAIGTISGFTGNAIWDAVVSNKPGIVELLLQYCADPNYVAENGASLLVWATGKKYTEIESILKKYGAKK